MEKTEALAFVAAWDEAHRATAQALTAAVQLARQSGASWHQIGIETGTTRQAAWEKWGKGKTAPPRPGQDPLPFGTG